MPKSYGRNERVAAAILREMAEILQRELKDPRVNGATVTEVRVSDDLRNATAYISFLTDDEGEVKQAMEALKKAKGFIRSTIAGRLNLRYMPDLVLKRDTLIKDSMKLDALIRKGLHRD
jgi:ribosome-binding factor A